MVGHQAREKRLYAIRNFVDNDIVCSCKECEGRQAHQLTESPERSHARSSLQSPPQPLLFRKGESSFKPRTICYL